MGLTVLKLGQSQANQCDWPSTVTSKSTYILRTPNPSAMIDLTLFNLAKYSLD